MVTKPLIDKVQAGLDMSKDDLALLQTLATMEEVPENEPEDRIIEKGDGEKKGPMVRTKSTSAGYVYLRRASDGKLKQINKNQLVERLKQKLPDGSPAWLPPNAPWYGKARVGSKLCLLHADHPKRALMDELGLPTCPKKNLLNDFAARRHVRLKHKDAWEAIQRDDDQRREDARDARDKTMTEALTAALSGKIARARPTDVASKEPVSLECEECHEAFEATGRLAVNNKLRAHIKKAHPSTGG